MPRSVSDSDGAGFGVAGAASAGDRVSPLGVVCSASPRSATWRWVRSSSYDTRSSRPIATQVIRMLEPPEEISGRVRPLVGSRPRFTPIETKLCMPIHSATPKAT